MLLFHYPQNTVTEDCGKKIEGSKLCDDLGKYCDNCHNDIYLCNIYLWDKCDVTPLEIHNLSAEVRYCLAPVGDEGQWGNLVFPSDIINKNNWTNDLQVLNCLYKLNPTPLSKYGWILESDWLTDSWLIHSLKVL